jgi:hypothetical protein
LRLGAPRTRLNVNIGIVGIHLTRKHAAKFEPGYLFLELREIADDFVNGFAIVFFFGESQQFVGLAQTRRHFVEPDDYLLKLCSFLAKCLRALRILPDIRLFEFALNLGQSLRFALVVKDTSSAHRSARRGRRSFV